MPRDGSPFIAPVVRWRSDDDENFFRNIKTGHIDPDVSNRDYIEQIQKRFWPHQKKKTFAVTYKSAVAKYRVHQVVEEAAACHCGGVQSKHIEDEEDADNKSFVGSKESDEELSGEEAAIPEVDLKEVETMPRVRRPAAKKLPPPKLGMPNKAATINTLTSNVERMTVSKYSPYGFDEKQPFKIWKFTDVSSNKIAVQFITQPLPEHFFKVEVSPDGEKLLFSCAVPGWYGETKHVIVEQEGEENFPRASAEMVGVVAVSKLIKEHEEMKGQLYWRQPKVIHLNERVEPNVIISVGLHPTNYVANVNGHDHAQFIQMITCHLTCVRKMKKNTVDRKVVVNNAFEFDNLFNDNSEGQTFEAAAPPADDMEDGSYTGYAYVDGAIGCKFRGFYFFCLDFYK